MLHNDLTPKCIPEALLKGVAISYNEFLIKQRKRSESQFRKLGLIIQRLATNDSYLASRHVRALILQRGKDRK